MRKNTATLLAAGAILAASCTETYYTDSLGIPVTPEENREYSYTDKKSGYWYGNTHSVASQWYSGWNIAKKRVLADYTLSINGEPLDRSQAECTVYPDRLVRKWENVTETFHMVDNLPILHIGIDTDAEHTSKSIGLDHTLISDSYMKEGYYPGIFFIPKEAPDARIMLASDGGEGYLLIYGTEEECMDLYEEFHSDETKLDRITKERKERINSLVTEYNPTKSNLPELNKALDWITITMDELITEQQGNGIYAGLPWFNEYWGRDMFISFPGACLVTGQFDVAKKILKDFVELQDTDPASETYGRIPNRANLEGILYNTTDGTPRLVIQALEVAKYSGDTEFLKELYPAIKMSIDASIKNYTDEKGYLTHADADTWMDVKRNGIPGSPRGNRANDIQALWYAQLMAGSEIAALMDDMGSAEEWSGLATLLASN
ncbi:MAG: hypothetical protein II991_04885, partial [Bacteroidales bacterium]|nr:hypothetical protein [Bacteroidales bacterium]